MPDQPSGDGQKGLCLALTHLQSALDALDEADAPPQIGAHVDLAMHQLREAIANQGPTMHGGLRARRI